MSEVYVFGGGGGGREEGRGIGGLEGGGSWEVGMRCNVM